MSQVPEIDLSRCSLCRGCEELCPDVFRMNPAGYMEVLERDAYPGDCVDEAIAICPEDCIAYRER